jgi:hypothetical protein
MRHYRVYVQVFEKTNRGQFSGGKISVYAGTRADANFVRSSVRGQFGLLLNGEFYLSVDSLLTRKGQRNGRSEENPPG